MSELLQQLGSQLDATQIQRLSELIGADTQQTSQAVSAVLPTLVGAMARQTEQPQHAAQLHQALQNDHDGSLLDHLGSFLGGSEAPVSQRSTAGERILDHVLGNRKNRVQDGVSRASGLTSSQSIKLMAMLAPILMGVLGKRQRQEKLSPSGLSEVLRGEEQSAATQAGGSLVGRLLDQDGDGDFDMMDVVKFGMGKMFGR